MLKKILTTNEYRVIELKILEANGLNNHAIANQLDMKCDTMKKIYSRALKKLRIAWERL